VTVTKKQQCPALGAPSLATGTPGGRVNQLQRSGLRTWSRCWRCRALAPAHAGWSGCWRWPPAHTTI